MLFLFAMCQQQGIWRIQNNTHLEDKITSYINLFVLLYCLAFDVFRSFLKLCLENVNRKREQNHVAQDAIDE